MIRHVSSDEALTHPSEDRLGRASFSEYLAKAISGMKAPKGLVVALNGPWGAGKTTLLNFVFHHLRKEAPGEIVTFTFNPWFFSGRERLLRRFLRDLGRLLGKPDATENLQEVSKWLARLDTVLQPLALVPDVQISLGSRMLRKSLSWFQSWYQKSKLNVAEEEQADVEMIRENIATMLSAQRTRVVVVIDDIDRLVKEEVLELFQIVKQIANFPNVIYVLAFDRKVVGKSLKSMGVSEGFIEKIVQVEFDIPPPERTRLRAILFEGVDDVLRDTAEKEFQQTAWNQLFWNGIDPFIQTPRDIHRYLNRVRLTYPAMRSEVNVVDFLGVQALRTFCPDLYASVQENRELVTGFEREAGFNITERHATYQVWLKAIHERFRPAATAMMKELFPRWCQVFDRTQYDSEDLVTWRKQLRVCSSENFDRYFSLSIPEADFSLVEVREILSLPKDAGALEAKVVSLSKQKGIDNRPRLWPFLDRIHDVADAKLAPQVIEAILHVIYDVGDDLSDRGRYGGFMESDTDMRMLGVTYVLLKLLPEQTDRFQMLQRVFSNGRAVYLMTRDVGMQGQEHGKYGANSAREPEERRLVKPDQLTELERLVLGRIQRDASEGTLAHRPHLGLLMSYWSKWDSIENVKIYVGKLVTDDQGLALFVDACTNTVHSSQEPYVEREVNRAYFCELWPGKWENLQQRAREILVKAPSWLTSEQRDAMQAFIKIRVDNMEGGRDAIK